MIELITAYSLKEIVIFLVIFALAVKGFISYSEWGYSKMSKVVKKKESLDNVEEQLDEIREQHKTDIKDMIEHYNELHESVKMLCICEQQDIKAFIVREYNYFVHQKKCIDLYSLECIEQSYKNYTTLGGNSYVHSLVEAIRALPRIDLSQHLEGE